VTPLDLQHFLEGQDHPSGPNHVLKCNYIGCGKPNIDSGGEAGFSSLASTISSDHLSTFVSPAAIWNQLRARRFFAVFWGLLK
jgi:hypothetical protein